MMPLLCKIRSFSFKECSDFMTEHAQKYDGLTVLAVDHLYIHCGREYSSCTWYRVVGVYYDEVKSADAWRFVFFDLSASVWV